MNVNDYGNLDWETYKTLADAGERWLEYLRAALKLDERSIPDMRILLQMAVNYLYAASGQYNTRLLGKGDNPPILIVQPAPPHYIHIDCAFSAWIEELAEAFDLRDKPTWVVATILYFAIEGAQAAIAGYLLRRQTALYKAIK